MKIEYSRQIFEKKIQISNFIKIRPIGEELFHAHGRTDRQPNMIKLTAAFFPRNFCERSEKIKLRNFSSGILQMTPGVA